MDRRALSAFFVYVMLAGSGWIVAGGAGGALPGWVVEVLVWVLVVAGALVAGPVPRVGREWLPACVAGLLLLGVPRLLLELPVSGLPAISRVCLLGLVPVALVVIAAAREGDGVEGGVLAAAVAGVAGLVLLLPVDLQALVQRPVALAVALASVVCVAAGSWIGHRALGRLPFRSALVAMLGPSAVLVGVVEGVRYGWRWVPQPGDVMGTGWGAVEVLLLVYLVRRAGAVAFAARFLLVPLVTVVEGLVYLRPQVDWRLLVGSGLVILAAVGLVRGGDQEADSSVLLL